MKGKKSHEVESRLKFLKLQSTFFNMLDLFTSQSFFHGSFCFVGYAEQSEGEFLFLTSP